MTATAAAATLSAPLWTDQISAWSAFAAAIIAAISAGIVLSQLRKLNDQLKRETQAFNHQTKSHEAQMLLSLSEKWSAILPARYAMMQFLEDHNNLTAFIGTPANPRKASDFFGQERWCSPDKGLRCVLNFYETLGLLIRQEYISAQDAFVLVSVDSFPAAGTNGMDCEKGSFFTLVQPVLAYLRQHYRADMYVWYDQYLLPLYCRHTLFLPTTAEVDYLIENNSQ